MKTFPSQQGRRWNRWLPVTAIAAAVLVAACGGGGSADSGSATVAAGPIQGFGSIIVNGVHYEHDRSGVRITGDDDSSASSADLKLGVVVDISAGRIDDNSRSVPNAISFRSALLGPVDSVDATANTLLILGQTVVVTDMTYFDSSITGGLAGIAAGDIVRVHGLFDKTTGETTATRLEKRSLSSVSAFRLRAVVSALDTSAKTFLLGGQLVDFSALSSDNLRTALADGAVVRARLQTTKNAAGAWVATRIDSSSLRWRDHDHHNAEVEGVIADFDSNAKFFINGLEVNASNAAFEPSSLTLADGLRVEAEGVIENGVLVAAKVEIKDRSGRRQGRHGGNGGGDDDYGTELHDVRIAAVDTTTQTLSLSGIDQQVRWDSSTVFERGNAAGLVAGAKLEIRAMPLASDPSILLAREIKFED
jgi:hypothetical protein